MTHGSTYVYRHISRDGYVEPFAGYGHTMLWVIITPAGEYKEYWP